MVSAEQVMLILVPALPLLGGLLLCAQWRRFSAASTGWTGVVLLGLSGVLGLLLWPEGASLSLPWISLPDAFSTAGSGQISGVMVPLAFSLGTAQLAFAVTCALVAALVIAFAIRERQGDPQGPRLLAQLTLFAGTMLLFVSADTLLIMYGAWEGMGLLSYFLIAHSGTGEAKRAAKQAFWTTRSTDFCLLFAILLLMSRFGWATFSAIDLQALILQAQRQGASTEAMHNVLGLAALLGVFAALGKAAQWPLSFWLPAAMTAPTPVSALLHAATMVAAGPYLLCQLRQLFTVSQTGLAACVILGGATMVLCGLMACAARDAKKLLAYSTASQLGLALMGIGALAEEASLMQLTAHAWIKAPLFLLVGYLAAQTAGHSTALASLAGSLRGRALAAGMLLLCAVSLAGFPLSGGAWGKESIVLALMTRAQASPGGGFVLGEAMPLAAEAWGVGRLLAKLGLLLTAAYTARLLFILWRRPAPAPEAGGDEPVQGRATGWTAALTACGVLTLMAAVGLSPLLWGLRAQLTSASTDWKWEYGQAGDLFPIVSSSVIILGAGIAWLALRTPTPALPTFISAAVSFFADGMRLEQFWRSLVGAPGWLAAIWAARNDRQVIDGLVMGTGRFGRTLAQASRWVDEHIVDGARYWGCEIWWILRRGHQRFLQTGYIQHYMFVVLLGAVVLCLVILRPLADIFGKIMGAI